MRRVMSWIVAVGLLTVGAVASPPVQAANVNGAWTAVGTTTLNEKVYVLAQEGAGTGTVYAGGFFTNAGGNASADYIASVDPSSGSADWQALTPTPLGAGSTYTGVYSIAPVASSNTVFIGGNFNTSTPAVEGIVSWDGNTSSNFAGLTGGGVALSSGNDGVEDLVAVDATTVYLSGGFLDAGGNANADNIALYRNGTWLAPTAVTANNVNALAYRNTTTVAVGGPFFVGGSPSFGHVALWECDPAPPSTTCGTFNNYRSVKADTATDLGFNPANTTKTVAHLTYIGTDLYAGGNFTTTNAATPVTVNGLAKWNGTSWDAVPSGGTGLNSSGIIETMATSVGATASSGYLYIGGSFTSINGVSATNVARMDLATGEWSSLGCGARNGVNGAVRGILPQSDGSVIVGGHFTDAGGNTALDYVARYTPGADNCSTASSGSDEPVFIDFDGNGGSCTPSSLRADAVSAAAAFETVKCSFGNRTLRGFSTNPNGNPLITAGDSFTFTGSNRYFAIWGSAKPQEVTATPGVNSVTVSWKPPVSDGGPAIVSYFVVGKSATQTNYDRFCQVVPTVNQCKVDLRATNLAYTFGVRVIDQLGFGEIVEAAAVSPYDISNAVASRANVLFGLRGSEVKASGLALGLAGKALNAEYKIGSAKNWTTEANAAKVNAEGRFSWSKRFAASANKQNVTLRFSYGADAVSGTFVLARGAESGDLSAPLNVKVSNDVNRIVVTWDPPKFTGGEKIIGHSMCATRGFSLCRDTGPEGKATFIGLIPGEPYTITVAARTAKRTGPSAEVKRKILPTEALVRIASRDTRSLEVNVEGRGFPEDSRFRLEVAIVEPSQSRDSWRWRTVRSFTGKSPTGNRRFSQIVEVALDASSDGRPVAARLVTPNGIVYSKMVRALG